MTGRKGFSYIEVLIAAALLSILMVPVVSGFYQAMANLKYSVAQYQAVLLAKSLVVEAENLWSKKISLDDILSRMDFSKDYDIPFEYMVAVYEFKSGELQLSEFKQTKFEGLDEASNLPIPAAKLEFSGSLNSLGESYSADAIIHYDGAFKNTKDSLGNFYGGVCQINYSEAEEKTVAIIFSNINGAPELIINNFGEGNLYVKVYTPELQPIQISFAEENRSSFVSYFEYSKAYEAIITAEIYDLNSRLLSKIIRPVYRKEAVTLE